MPDDTNRHPDLVKFDRAVAEHETRQLADELGYTMAVLTDGTIVLEPPVDPNCGGGCAAIPPRALVALPKPDELDDDGQVWFDDYDVRVDTTGYERSTIYVEGRRVRSIEVLEGRACALLAAIAFARSKR